MSAKSLVFLFITGVVLTHFLFFLDFYGEVFPGISDFFKLCFILGYTLCVAINAFSFRKNSLLYHTRYKFLIINVIVLIGLVCLLVINANYFSNWRKKDFAWQQWIVLRKEI